MTEADSDLSANSGTERTLWTRRFVYILLTVFGIFWSYLTLLIVLPLEIADQGGSNTAIGMGTGLFMAAAVIAQLSTPRLLARYRIRTLLFPALLLLGIPSLLQPMADSISVTFGLNLVRGVGIGIGSVVGATGVSILSPPARRGEALGLFGLATAVPGVVGPAIALALLPVFSFAGVFVGLGLTTFLACAATLPLGSLSAPAGGSQSGIIEASRQPAMLLPFLTFTAMTAVYGSILTFAPLHLMESQRGSPAMFLFVLGATYAVSRYYGGVIVDRVGPSRVLLAGLFCSMASIPLLGWASFPYASLLSGMLFGLSFGAIATSTHFRLLSRAKSHESGAANALFNVAFNAGIGIGGLLFGGVASVAGYPLMFTFAALWVSLTVAIFLIDRAKSKGR